MPVSLLLATPDVGLADAVRLHTADAGWRLCVATSAEQAVNAALHPAVDVAVVDDRLEAIGSRTVAGWLEQVSAPAHPRLVTLGGPESPAVDLRRPVVAAQLVSFVARLQAMGESPRWAFAVDTDALAVRSAHGEQRLTPSEYRLLRALLGAGDAGIASPSLAAVTGGGGALRVHIANLRRKLRLVTAGATGVVAEQGRYRLRQDAAH
jgi:DNA-binding response OmpR family regulator